MYTTILQDGQIVSYLADGAERGFYHEEPLRPSDVYAGKVIRDLEVRGGCRTGVRLHNCWNPRLQNVIVSGVLTHEENEHPSTMQIGIDLHNSMDAHVIGAQITTARIGIHAGDPDPAATIRAEGLHIERGFLMHNEIGCQLIGTHLGGWPTPAGWFERMHVNHLTYGLFGYLQSGLHVVHNDFYASHFRTGQWAVYLVACKNVVIDGNHFWANRPGDYGAIVLDACENVVISGGVVDDSVNRALWVTPSCKNIYTSGPTWERAQRQGKVFNYGTYD